MRLLMGIDERSGIIRSSRPKAQKIVSLIET
jgi:hypothetical protein